MAEQRTAGVLPEVSLDEFAVEVDRTISQSPSTGSRTGGAAARPGRPEAGGPGPALTAAASLALAPGFRLHEYRIDAILGQGGFGIAYAATDVNLNTRVVVKEYLPEDFAYRAVDGTIRVRDGADRDLYHAGLERFLVEARTLASFRHRHIVRVARFFEANRTGYMVLEYERGQSLKSWRKNRDSIPESTLVALVGPLLDGLATVHRAGFLHRDIKPDNIYIRDEDGSLVLLDFGSARRASIEFAEVGTIVTPGYSAIEQYAGGERQGPWTDIYSMGATLYWLVTGQKPLEAAQRLALPDPLPRAETLGEGRHSPEFLCAIDWALRMHPDDRPADIATWRALLFAAHPGALGLEQALRAQDTGATESWAATLRSPRRAVARAWRGLRSARRPGSWPIALKMTLAMVATALVPLAIAAWYTFSAASEHLTRVELTNLEQLAQSTSGRVSQLVADTRNLADYVGTDDDFVGYLTHPTTAGHDAILAKLDGLGIANADLQFAMVMDTAGNALVASDREVMGRNFAFRDYFKQAMEGHAYMTGITVGSVAGRAGVFYSRPVFASDGHTVIGTVVLRIRAEPIERILDASRLGNDRRPMLVDAEGVILWHPDERLMYRSLRPLAPEVIREIVADQRYRRPTVDSANEARLAAAVLGNHEPGHVAYYSMSSARDEIAGYAPVPGTDWTVVVSESRVYFGAALERLLQNVLYGVAFVGAVSLLFAMLFARSIVRPIERLTSAAHALKSGDYASAHVEVHANDEVGQLARTFNVMIDVLRQREREREPGVHGPDD
ncbi:MAG TPA: cache domain-containing protein [Usitatibacter sp.]|nr:cache domain-containing protein [Usitatibacter sp.]